MQQDILFYTYFILYLYKYKTNMYKLMVFFVIYKCMYYSFDWFYIIWNYKLGDTGNFSKKWYRYYTVFNIVCVIYIYL